MSFAFWAAVAVCAVAQAFIIAAAIRSKPAQHADGHVPQPSRASEVAWTIIPAIGLVLLFLFTHRALQAAEPAHHSATHSSAGVMK